MASRQRGGVVIEINLYEGVVIADYEWWSNGPCPLMFWDSDARLQEEMLQQLYAQMMGWA